MKKPKKSMVKESRTPPHFRWPREVFVLTMNDLKGGAGCDEHNNPQTVFHWADVQCRCHYTPFRDLILFLDIWVDVFVALGVELKNRRMVYKKCDQYNATWAVFGYTENQCPRALKIAAFFKGKVIITEPIKWVDDPADVYVPPSRTKMYIK